MAVHIIPEDEKAEHIEDPACKCEPDLKMDEESGEITWIHQILDWGKQFANIFKF